MVNVSEEKKRQESFVWSRTKFHSMYNRFLAEYKVQACLENKVGESLLDIACGDGLMTEMLSGYFSSVVGVDASGTHLAEAKKRLPDSKFFETLIEDFDTEAKFDTITMLDLLEHVEDPKAVLLKAASMLTSNGVLIVHVPNAHAINRRLSVFMGTLEDCEELTPFDLQIAGHRRSYHMSSLRKEIESAGLTVRSTGGIFYKMLSTAQMDWFLTNGLWEGNEFGWGRVGGPDKDWRAEFCRACYELGREQPEDCNIIYACITR